MGFYSWISAGTSSIHSNRCGRSGDGIMMHRFVKLQLGFRACNVMVL